MWYTQPLHLLRQPACAQAHRLALPRSMGLLPRMRLYFTVLGALSPMAMGGGVGVSPGMGVGMGMGKGRRGGRAG